MKICHLSKWDTIGGAARAAHKVHRSLLHCGVDSFMRVHYKASDEWRVIGPGSDLERYTGQVKSALSRAIGRLQKEPIGGPRKGSWFPSNLSGFFNASDFDVVNLHWISEETISMLDLHRIRRPLVWRLPDMWPFCGMEHYTTETEDARWKVGYEKANRPRGAGGLDLDRRLFLAKRRAYERQLSLVAPSGWLAQCARQSVLMRDKPIHVIPNPLDLETFKPLDRGFSRTALGLPPEATLVSFGAVGGSQNHRKGFDLLAKALQSLKASGAAGDIHCCVFGQSRPEAQDIGLTLPVIWAGSFSDDVALAVMYSASDLFISPATQEGYANTCAEAAACGCPSVAFRGTGAEQTITDRETGYLAEMENAADLAKGIAWCLLHNRDGRLSMAARAKAIREWNFDVVGPAYRAVYETAIEEYRRNH